MRFTFVADSRPRIWLLIALLTLVLRLPALVQPFFFAQDEATYSALGVRTLAGAALYSGAVDHKPPGVAVTYALIYRLFGANRIVAVHIVLLIVVALTAVVLGEVAVRLDGRPAAAIAGVIYAVASAVGPPGDMQAANTELFLNLPLALAAACVVGALLSYRVGARSETWLMFAAGVLTGGAAFYKYQAALAGLAWCAAVWLETAPRGTRLLWLTALASGFTLTAVAYCGWFALNGTWDNFVFWGWRYNFTYINDLDFRLKLWNAIFYTALVGAFWLPLLILAARSVRASRPEVLSVAWLVAGAWSVSIGGRYFPHYYLMVLPPLVLLAAPTAARLMDRPGGRLAATIRAVRYLTVAAVGVSLFMAWDWANLKPGLRRHHGAYTQVGTYIRTHSSPEDTVFVWGNSSPIYYYAERVMGTRFPFCNYQTGKIWGTPADAVDAGDTSMLVVPRAWTELLLDLDRTPPTFIVDAAAGRLDRFDDHPLSRYAALMERLTKYRIEAVVEGVPIYRFRSR
jgi:hypothetical protein